MSSKVLWLYLLNILIKVIIFSNLAEFDQLTYNSYERETPKSISGLLSKVTLLFALLLLCTSKSIEKRSLIM
ncbi:hypothetical protein KSF78_0001289 [Schistosoma japonicum]|nr:hypothetical protein KSF78_0001289 [Schistosoma japonicum]